MASGTVTMRIRNEQDNGWTDVEVPVKIGSPFRCDLNSKPNCGGAPGGTASAIATAGAGTYLVANLAAGIITRDCAGASRTDTTDTAANIIANATVGLDADYKEFACYVVNTSSGAYTITLAGGTGVTLQGTITIAQNAMTRLIFFRTSATTLVVRQG